jgi:zinc protease
MNSTSIAVASAAALLATLTTLPLCAQVTTPPPLGAAPTLTLPTNTTFTLDNGMTVVVSRNAEVPLVSARLIIAGGARTTGAAPGLATFTASMLDEGAGGKDALELAEAVDFIGASLSTRASWEEFTLSVSGPKRTFADAMALLADVTMRPAFAEADISRERDARQSALIQAKDSPSQVANRVFARNVFPEGHPYHQNLSGDSTTTAALNPASVSEFWASVSNPENAVLIITGDVTTDEARGWAGDNFGEWSTPEAPASKAPPSSISEAPRPATRVILVDKPGAPQSVIYIGAPGVERDNPDYPAISVMNTILGGSFSSRLNDILREQRGYSYGASSDYQWNPVPGPFVAAAQVRTDVTDSSLAVFFHEFERIRDEPVPATELERARNYVVLGALGDYETAGQVASAIATAMSFGQPLEQTAADLGAMSTVTAEQVRQSAQEYLDPSRLTVLVVGDIAAIRPGIERLRLGPIEVQEF